MGVYEGVKLNRVVEYIASNAICKIMTTPESFCKVKSACEKLGINIYADFFLLMDECHQLITDVDYRIDIVMPMNDFFMFKRKALVSATPIGFSDPRFGENLFDTIEVEADYDYRQDITVTHTYNIAKAVGEYLETHNGTVCFFVNSVVTIYSLMKHFNLLEDSSVYCAPKSRSKLKNEYIFHNAYSEWSSDTMKKYNFFTGRFFTAFDLELDYKPDLVMITDPHRAEYTLLDIDTDCIQICGRFRNGVNSVTHIYEANPDIVAKDREQIEWEISAHEVVYNTLNTLYNSADTKEKRFAFSEALETLPFRKFQYPDFTKNWFAIDNEINAVMTKSITLSKSIAPLESSAVLFMKFEFRILTLLTPSILIAPAYVSENPFMKMILLNTTLLVLIILNILDLPCALILWPLPLIVIGFSIFIPSTIVSNPMV